MGKIVEYKAKRELTPTSEGYSALETGARRVGPLFQQAASDVEKQGKMQAETATAAEKYTLEFTAPYDSLLGRRGGGGGLNTRGAGRSDQSLIGTGSNNAVIRNAPDDEEYGDIVNGAAKLSRMANHMTPGGNPYSGVQSDDNLPEGKQFFNGVPVPAGFMVNNNGDLVLTQAGQSKFDMQRAAQALIAGQTKAFNPNPNPQSAIDASANNGRGYVAPTDNDWNKTWLGEEAAGGNKIAPGMTNPWDPNTTTLPMFPSTNDPSNYVSTTTTPQVVNPNDPGNTGTTDTGSPASLPMPPPF